MRYQVKALLQGMKCKGDDSIMCQPRSRLDPRISLLSLQRGCKERRISFWRPNLPVNVLSRENPIYEWFRHITLKFLYLSVVPMCLTIEKPVFQSSTARGQLHNFDKGYHLLRLLELKQFYTRWRPCHYYRVIARETLFSSWLCWQKFMAMSCKVLLGFVLLTGLVCSSFTAGARLSSRYRAAVEAGMKILQRTHSKDRENS